MRLRFRETRDKDFDWFSSPYNFLWHKERTPPLMVEHLLRHYGRPGITVFDPYAGVGTTMMLARRLEMEAFGDDLDPHCSIQWAPEWELATRSLPNKYVDLVLTAPPLLKTYRHGSWYKGMTLWPEISSRLDTHDCAFPHYVALIRTTYEECYRALRDDGKMVVIVRDILMKNGKRINNSKLHRSILDKTPLVRVEEHEMLIRVRPGTEEFASWQVLISAKNPIQKPVKEKRKNW